VSRKPLAIATVAMALAVLFYARGFAQTPPPDSTADTPVPTTSSLPTSEPSPAPGTGMVLTFRIRSERVDDRQLTVPPGAQIVVRGGRGVCATVAVDVAALNSLREVVLSPLEIRPSGVCGTPGEVLAIELLFPGEGDRQGQLLASIDWQDGLVADVELLVRAPIPVPLTGTDPGTLPATGAAAGGDGLLWLIAFGLVAAGAGLIVAYVALAHRRAAA